MLRPHLIEYETKARKVLKTDIQGDSNYDEFSGYAIDSEEYNMGIQKTKQKEVDVKVLPLNQEKQKYRHFYAEVSKGLKYRKVGGTDQQKRVFKVQNFGQQPKKEEKEQKSEKKKKTQKSKQNTNENWKKFLQEQKKQTSNTSFHFVAIDCEFVKCGQQDALARFSAVSQAGETLLDIYVKPSKKITDYVTNISGITYKHIKNAPLQDEAMIQIKKVLLNKILIGHTIGKDLGVLGLEGWRGLKGKIDIADSRAYSDKGKRVSLKNLTFKHLGQIIQETWHSSIQDATATMNLFLKNKTPILRENGWIK